MDRRNCWEVLLDRSTKAVDMARQGCIRASSRVHQLEAQMQRLQALLRDLNATPSAASRSLAMFVAPRYRPPRTDAIVA